MLKQRIIKFAIFQFLVLFLFAAFGPHDKGVVFAETSLVKYVSKQGVFSVYKPKDWTVDEEYTASSMAITVNDKSKTSEVGYLIVKNADKTKNCLYLMGKILKELKKQYPDLKFYDVKASQDKSKAVANVSYTEKGVPIQGKYYFTANPEALLMMGFHAPQNKFLKQKKILLTVLNNINFYDKVEEQKTEQKIEQQIAAQIQPVKHQMAWRQASDGSSKILVPAGWGYQAQKGKVLLGSEQEDAGFLFTSMEVSSYNVPGMMVSPYVSPSRFIGVFLTQFGGARNIQILEANQDTKTAQEAMQFLGKKCEAQDIVMRYSSKSGRTCLGTFKVINFAPSPISGMWYSIISGFWAPEDKFPAYAPLLMQIGSSYQLDDKYAANYIQAGLANLKRLQQKTQQAMKELSQAKDDQLRSWEANQARKDYTNWKWSQQFRGQTDWVSDLEGGKVYHTDSWGTQDTATGNYYEGSPYNYVNYQGENPKHPGLETMQEVNTYELYQKYILGQ